MRLRRQRGFTLIEVMLVIMIAGILISGVTLVLSGKSMAERASDEAVRLHATIQIASDYALLNNAELGLVVTEQSYQFVHFLENEWHLLEEQPSLSEHSVDDTIQLSLTFDDLSSEEMPYELPTGLVIEDEDEEISEEQKKLVPQVMIFSGGEMTPFMVNFVFIDEELDEHVYSVSSPGFAPAILDFGNED